MFELSDIKDDELLLCGVCRQYYTEPITLCCQHTFCDICLIKDDKIKCPICNLLCDRPNNTNLLLEEIIIRGYTIVKYQYLLNNKFKKKLEYKKEEYKLYYKVIPITKTKIVYSSIILGLLITPLYFYYKKFKA